MKIVSIYGTSIHTFMPCFMFETVAELVKQRLRLEGMVGLLNEGLESTQNGTWGKFTSSSRPLSEVLIECKDLVGQYQAGEEITSRFISLAAELAAFPDTYHALLLLIGNKDETMYLETRTPAEILHDGKDIIRHDSTQLDERIHNILSHSFH